MMKGFYAQFLQWANDGEKERIRHVMADDILKPICVKSKQIRRELFEHTFRYIKDKPLLGAG